MLETMTGVWLEDNVLRVRNDLPIPTPPADEALIEVIRAGICNTDLELVRGYYPYRGVLGHEFVGRVVAGPTDWLGQRVVGEINSVCNTCSACRNGRPTHCENRTVLGIVNRDGAMARYTTLPVQNLHRVPDTVSDDAATFTEPLAAALEIQEQVPVRPTDRVLVVGPGKLGNLVAQTLALTGCDLTVVGRSPAPLQLLAGMGIRTATTDDITNAGYDVVVEVTGHSEGFALARRALRPRGTLVMKSTYAGRLTIDMSAIVVDEITVVGSRCGPFAPALRLLAAGRVQVAPLIQATYPLSEATTAFNHAAERGVLKVLLDPTR